MEKNIELTPQQRLKVYKALLREVCKDPSVEHGMCYYLISLLDRSKKMPTMWEWMGGCDKMELLYELKRKAPRPEPDSGYWAPANARGWEQRIRWIEESIIEVKKQIKCKE